MFQKVLFTIFNFVPVIQTFTGLFWDFFKGLYILEMFAISTFDKHQPIKSVGNVLLGWLLERFDILKILGGNSPIREEEPSYD